VPPKPLPPPPGPTSTCQFLSTNSFANNGFSVHFGHAVQNLAAQPPVPDLGFIPGSGYGYGDGLGGGLTTGAPLDFGRVVRGGGGSTGFGATHAPAGLVPGPAPAALPRLVLAGVPYRDWLVFGYGAWGCAVLAALCLWALAIHRRRLSGLL
jgi:hypothetical protein